MPTLFSLKLHGLTDPTELKVIVCDETGAKIGDVKLIPKGNE